MAFKMKNQSMAKLTKAAGDSRVAMKMKAESAMKMKKESAMKKELVGKQGNLPPELKAKIEAAPSKMKSPMTMKEKSAMKKEGGSITAFGKKYTYANAEEKKALLAKFKTMSQEKKEKKKKEKKYISKEKYNKLKAIDKQYTDLMNQGTGESMRKAEKLLNSTSSYIQSGSIGAEKKKRADEKNKQSDSAVPMKRKTQVDGEQVTASKASGGMFMKKEEIGVSKSGRKAFVKDEGAGKFKITKGNKSKTLSTGPGKKNELTKKNLVTDKTTTKEVSQRRANRLMKKTRKGVAKAK